MSIYNVNQSQPEHVKGVSSSSTLALGTELLLAKEQFEKDKADRKSRPRKRFHSSEKAPPKRNKGVALRSRFDESTRDAEPDANDKSHRILTQKARRYEELRQGGSKDGLEHELIDFGGKSSLDVESDPDDYEIIDTVDEFGRTRVEKRRIARITSVQEKPASVIRGDFIQSFDPDEAIAERIRTATDELATHFNAKKEVRSKGVGFYQFAKDEESRAQQMKELINRRRETERSRAENIRERRAQQLADRRKLIREKMLEIEAEIHMEDTSGVD